MRSLRAQKAEPEDALPAVIGSRYHIVAALGRGGVAQVYRVTDAANGNALALKLLIDSESPVLRELFELEYQTLASLDHSRTPRVFDFGRDERGIYYTMELLEGGDLTNAAPLPWQTVCAYVRDACLALGLLHARQLVHRDVSPRNLWRTPDGRVKLIDFGALAAFGPNRTIVGTPAFVAPEVLAARSLDQRTDLYALGGVAYYLLTGLRPYAARSLRELPDLWRTPPLAPSVYAEKAGLEPIPPELEALVLALLRNDELARPNSAGEVIDRIDSLCGRTPGAERDAALAHLQNTAFVGQARARRRLSRLLRLSARGRGQACVLEAASGGGRSRTLKELEWIARVSQASVLSVNASAETGSYGVVGALALGLLATLPGHARTAAEPHAGLLAHLSPRVRDLLQANAAAASEIPGELRTHVQEAARDWFLSVAHVHPVVLLVDGLEHADDGSVAILLSLALGLRQTKLLLVCALEHEAGTVHTAAVRALRSAAHQLRLPPLTAAEVLALLRSVFGAAEHLERLCGRLFELSSGNPGHVLELCRQLVASGAITFESGTWVLPRELDTRALASSRDQRFLSRLSHIQGAARQFAQRLSLHDGPLTPGICRALAADSGGAAQLLHLGELITAEILVASGQNLLFAHGCLRNACAAELTPPASQAAHRALAEYLESAPGAGPLERLQAAVHWLAIGDDRGRALAVHECLWLVSHEIDTLSSAAPALEAALSLMRAGPCSPYDEAVLLATLTRAGLEGERRLVLQYSESAIRILEQLLGLLHARKLRAYLGGKLGLAVALGLAALRFAWQGRKKSVLAFPEALQLLFNAVASATAASSICFDPDGAERWAEALQPFAALGPDHRGAFMYEFCQAIAATVRDRQPLTYARWQSLLHRLEAPRSKVKEGVTPAQQRRLRGGVLFGMGGLETMRDTEEALSTADKLAQNGLKLDQMFADQIRLVYYMHRGDTVAREHYRRRTELHAIARGTSWQIEAWLPGPMSIAAVNMHDALAMKHASEQMRRLSEDIPALAVHARQMRGTYLLLRGRPREALPLLEDCLQKPPNSHIAWARAHGLLARAYNRLKDYARAEATCGRVFAHCGPEHFEYPAINLIVQTEHAIACAGLGQSVRSRERLDALRATHGTSKNPLFAAQVCEAALEVALITEELGQAQQELARIKALYRPLSLPSLAQHVTELAARLERARNQPGAHAETAAADGTPTESTWETAADGEKLPRLAKRVLQALAENALATKGALYLVQSGATPQLCATLNSQPPTDLMQRCAHDYLANEVDDDHTLLTSELAQQQERSNVKRDGAWHHLLQLMTAGQGHVVGLAVLGREGEAPLLCPNALLRSFADELQTASACASSESSSPPTVLDNSS